MNIIKLFLILLFFGTVAACSSSQESAKEGDANGEESVYVFDDVFDVEDEKGTEEGDTEDISVAEPVADKIDTTSSVPMYIVQIGAFSTESLAGKYVEQMSSKIDYELNVHQNIDVSLFVVQLPPFRTREEAENVRNELWKIKEFKDAFIVPQL